MTARAERYALATFLLVLSFAASVVAGPLEDARAAYDRSDYESALRLYLPLADQGNAEAQDKVGNIFAQILDMPHDYATAVGWYQKAAKQGYAPSQANLGTMFRYGLGVVQDYKEAVKFFRKAAAQGDYGAQFSLAEMYETGQGLPQDFMRSYMWYNLAAMRGDTVMQGNSGRAATRRDGVATKMTLEQIAEAQKLAREWTGAK